MFRWSAVKKQIKLTFIISLHPASRTRGNQLVNLGISAWPLSQPRHLWIMRAL